MINPIQDAIAAAKRVKANGSSQRSWSLMIGTPLGWITRVSVGPDNKSLFSDAGEQVFFNPANVARVTIEWES
jgi:hypothetical protein